MDTLIYVLLMPVVVGFVLYLIIKYAVKAGVKEAYRELLPPQDTPKEEE